MGIEGESSIAPFRHLVNVQGEYCEEHCMSNSESRFMGLWGPVLMFKLTDYNFKVFHVKDSKGVEHEARGFELTLPFPGMKTAKRV